MNRKNWLSGLLTVSLAVIPTCTITAEENSKIVDQKQSSQRKTRVKQSRKPCCFLLRKAWIQMNIV